VAAALGFGRAGFAAPSADTGNSTDPSNPYAPHKEPLTDAQIGTAEAKEGAALLQTVSSLGPALTERFPGAYAGISSTTDNEYTIHVVGDQDGIRQYVRQQLAAVSTGIVPLPTVDFEGAEVPEIRLTQLRDSVVKDLPYWKERGTPVHTGGLDARRNALVLTFFGPVSGETRALFAERYGLSDDFVAGGHIVYQSIDGGTSHYTSRAADTAPWNAGDVLTGTSHQCTSGFGAHTGNGGQLLLFAGHCSFTQGNSDTWKNNGVVVGTDGLNFFGVSGFDASVIPTSSSHIFWKGAGTRKPVSNFITPTVGQGVCNEGAFGLENCGTIGGTDLFYSDGVYTSFGEYVYAGFVAQGDSGGPSVVPSGFGYLGAGIISADDTLPNGLQFVYDTSINVFRNAYHVELNT
jgi:hypothetical protein